MKMKNALLSVMMMFFFIFSINKIQAQTRSFYTVIQAGGMLGVQTNKDLDPLNGFQFQFIFGQGINNKFYYGFGLGSDTYRGSVVDSDGTKHNRKTQMLPLFADFRVPVSEVGMLGRLTAFGNVGYAPKLSNQYMKGGLGKVGLSYEHLLADNSFLKLSLGYGVQDFRGLTSQSSFLQQQVSLQIGLIVL